MSPPDLIVWRHGRTGWNADGRFQGHTDTSLDEVGLSQVSLAAPVLAALGPSRILSSDARRASASAAVLAGLVGLPVEEDARLREVDVGDWAGLTRSEIADRYPEEFAAWLAGGDIGRSGSGERYRDVAARAWECLAPLLSADAGGPVVAVTHGGTSLSLIAKMLEIPWELRRRLGPLGNARWSRLTPYGGAWRLIEHNVGVLDPPTPP